MWGGCAFIKELGDEADSAVDAVDVSEYVPRSVVVCSFCLLWIEGQERLLLKHLSCRDAFCDGE